MSEHSNPQLNQNCAAVKQFQLVAEHKLKDLRDRSKITYALHTLLTVIVLAKMAGCASAEKISSFWAMNLEGLKSFIYGLGDEIPTGQTLRRVISILNKENLLNFFTVYFLTYYAKGSKSIFETGRPLPLEERDVIGADGQNIRSTNLRRIDQDGKVRKHSGSDVVTLYSTKFGLTLCQIVKDKKNQEAQAISEMLECVNISGTILAWDALNTRPKLLQEVVDHEADFVVVVKDNNGDTKEELEDTFSFIERTHDEAFTEQMLTSERHDSGHGRIESRVLKVLPAECLSREFRRKWPMVNSVYQVITTRMDKLDGKISKETESVRYYLSSLLIDYEDMDYASKIQNIILQRWRIEIEQHYALDVFFDQDRLPMRNQRFIANNTFVTKMAYNILSFVKHKISELGGKDVSMPKLQLFCNNVSTGFAFMKSYIENDAQPLTELEILYRLRILKEPEPVDEKEHVIIVKDQSPRTPMEAFILRHSRKRPYRKK